MMWMNMSVSIVVIMVQVEVCTLHPQQPVGDQSQGIHHPFTLLRDHPVETHPVVIQEAVVIRVEPATEEEDQQVAEIIPVGEVLAEVGAVRTTMHLHSQRVVST